MIKAGSATKQHFQFNKMLIYYSVDNSILRSIVVSGLHKKQHVAVLRCYPHPQAAELVPFHYHILYQMGLLFLEL